MDLRYPIGQYAPPDSIGPADVEGWIAEIEALPGQVRAAIEGLDDEQLETAYRPGGWTLRQVVHHLLDSHLNSYIRFKWALTEDEPAIKTYEEARWAELADYRRVRLADTLDLLELLHARWATLLRSLGPDELARTFRHPEWGRVELDWNIGNYAWHGRHHLAHLTTTIEREGWATGDGSGVEGG